MSHIEDMNYYSDHRVRARAGRNDSPIVALDQSRMLATILVRDGRDEFEEVVPFHFGVCPTCRGKGTHVNPSVDSGGLTREDFEEDPDFAEYYLGGVYDVQCYECDGDRVVPELSRDQIAPEILKALDEKSRADELYRREVEAERRMGA